MKSFSILALAASSALAAPSSLEARQFGSTRNDLEDGDASACPQAILIFARATGEAGNIVGLLIPMSLSRH